MGARTNAKRMVVGLAAGTLGAVALPAMAAPAVAGAAGATEHFELVFASQTAPGSIFARGVFTGGGTDFQGNRTDEAVFADGAFRIVHGGIHPTFTFNQTTCTGKLRGSGPYRLTAGYGAYAKIKGSGTAHLQGTIATGRNANGTCNFHDVTAYSLIVHASGPVSF